MKVFHTLEVVLIRCLIFRRNLSIELYQLLWIFFQIKDEYFNLKPAVVGVVFSTQIYIYIFNEI